MFDIELLSVSKSYSGASEPAVKDLNLAVKKGEIITILGPSGCGKTTTLRLIAGFEIPSAGKIMLCGTEIASNSKWVPPEKRGIGMVFQDYALFPHLTVSENVAFGLTNSPNKEQRTAKVITLVGLDGYEKRYPHELSGGQQQRVALARALAPRPLVILLDEPFSNLDNQLRKYMRQEIRDILKSEGMTALFVTHDQKEAFELSDNIVVINNGIIEQQGSPQELYLHPRSEFVASFLGKTNFFNGTINKDLSVDTEIGRIDCASAQKSLGELTKVVIRPNAFRVDTHGMIKGVIKKLVFKGDIIEGVVEINTADNANKEIVIYLHPYQKLNCGDNISLKIIPDAAVILRE